MTKNYIRMGDMDPRRSLVIHIQEDGDIVVTIGNPYLGDDGVEFCTIASGGGRSEYTLAALRHLAKAIEKDNEEFPIYIGDTQIK